MRVDPSETKAEIDAIANGIQSTAMRQMRQLRLNVGRAMKFLRVKHGFSACAIASYAGVSRSYISRIESGAVLPSQSIIEAYEFMCKEPIDLRFKPHEVK